MEPCQPRANMSAEKSACSSSDKDQGCEDHFRKVMDQAEATQIPCDCPVLHEKSANELLLPSLGAPQVVRRARSMDMLGCMSAPIPNIAL